MAVDKKIFRDGSGRERTHHEAFFHKAINHSVEFGCCTLQRKDFTVNEGNSKYLYNYFLF